MGSENFNRQFILLDFADLDNPDFLAFTRAPEFSTYLVMRRHVWRSAEPQYMPLWLIPDIRAINKNMHGGVLGRGPINDVQAELWWKE